MSGPASPWRRPHGRGREHAPRRLHRGACCAPLYPEPTAQPPIQRVGGCSLSPAPVARGDRGPHCTRSWPPFTRQPGPIRFHTPGRAPNQPSSRGRMVNARERPVLLGGGRDHPPDRGPSWHHPCQVSRDCSASAATESSAASEQAGFSDVSVQAVPSPLRMTSAAECLRLQQESYGSLHEMLAGLDQAGREAAWQEVGEALAEFDGADGFIGPCELLVGAANAIARRLSGPLPTART